MDFNGRYSMARAQQPPGTSRKQAPEEVDAFMMPDTEIATCITEIGIPCTVPDLQKPVPQHIQKIFEYFAYILMNTSRDVVSPAMSAAAADIAGADADRLYSADTRDLMGLFVMLRGLLEKCSIDDFAFSDLYRPTHARLQKILSYVINFVRFRESQTSVIDTHFDEAERTKARVAHLYAEKSDLEARLAALQRARPGVDKSVKDKEARLAELKPRLRALDQTKDKLAAEWHRCEVETERLKGTYEERATQLDGLRAEAARLRPYTAHKPDALEAGVRDLNAALAGERALIEALERRTRALGSSVEGFSAVSGDVQAVTRLLADLAGELGKEEEERAKAARHREALSERVSCVEDVERQERLLVKQLDSMNARTEKLRRGAEEKSEAARVRMEELKAVHGKLVRERGEKAREVERRRVRIEQTEKKMADLKENIENEVHAAREEYLKMESHIKLYIHEMEQSIS
ncbi:kinetochore protein nuf2 [Trichodelitschia bisporula]|uniref:Probable kinetochore protein NUF2 n=1 Tax=Trichodelitschia bisporula TaxID=703511 RepID=A0A6G1HKS9_9PEZI|nr:kinetochore protein nuf2 [Trichodelitschia bisporula]